MSKPIHEDPVDEQVEDAVDEQEPPHAPPSEPQGDPAVPNPERAPGSVKGWAVYDVTLQRFASGLLDEEAAHAAAERGPASHQLEVREV